VRENTRSDATPEVWHSYCLIVLCEGSCPVLCKRLNINQGHCLLEF
jgi:hypothetical protein